MEKRFNCFDIVHNIKPILSYTVELTYAEYVKTKSLCHRFTDQLVREAVKSNMATQIQVTLLFILQENKTRKGLVTCEENAHGGETVTGRAEGVKSINYHDELGSHDLQRMISF